MFKGRAKAKHQAEREGARFIKATDPLAYLVGSRGAFTASEKPAPEPEPEPEPEGPDAAAVKLATYRARQTRKKQRRRERWETQIAEGGGAVHEGGEEGETDAGGRAGGESGEKEKEAPKSMDFLN